MSINKQILWTACVTPFDRSGNKIDYTSFKHCLNLQNKNKNGIVLLGSTGENLSLTNNERQKIVEFACNLNLQTKIIVGIPSYNLNYALDWIEFCNNLPITGYLMTAPIYTKPGIIGQTYWFEKLLNKSKYHSILYNIPSRTGMKLHNETVKNLCQHKNFIAIKNSSDLIQSSMEYQNIAPNIEIFCGDDYMMPAIASIGGIGLISVASNVWPSATRKYVKYVLNDDFKLCLNKKYTLKIWWESCKALFLASNPIPLKILMKKNKIIKNETVRPPLNKNDFKFIKLLLKYNKIIIDWNNLNK